MKLRTMKNKKLKKTMLKELDEDMLDQVSGGTFGDWETCPMRSMPKREGCICIHCDMADDVVTCFRCRSPLTRETGCAHCGTTWDEYLQITAPLRNK